MSQQPQSPPRPSRSLKGKVAIVTGAGSQGEGIGNGRAIALLLAEDGASVVCVDRELSLARRTAEMITEEAHGAAVPIQADVSHSLEVQRMFKQIEGEAGPLDVLVCNAGVTQDTLLGASTAEDFEKVLATNLMGAVHCCREASRTMISRRQGVILNVSGCVVDGLLSSTSYEYAKLCSATHRHSQSL